MSAGGRLTGSYHSFTLEDMSLHLDQPTGKRSRGASQMGRDAGWSLTVAGGITWVSLSQKSCDSFLQVTDSKVFEGGYSVPWYTSGQKIALRCDKPGTEWMEMQVGPGPFGRDHEKDMSRMKVIKEPKQFRLSGKALLHR